MHAEFVFCGVQWPFRHRVLLKGTPRVSMYQTYTWAHSAFYLRFADWTLALAALV